MTNTYSTFLFSLITFTFATIISSFFVNNTVFLIIFSILSAYTLIGNIIYLILGIHYSKSQKELEKQLQSEYFHGPLY